MSSASPPSTGSRRNSRRFVGALPVVGHNVGFDLGFVRAQRLLMDNVGLDTWELSTILFPGQPSYSLGSLAQSFGFPKRKQPPRLA